MNFLVQIIVGVILSVASTLLQQAFAPQPQEQARRTGTRGSAQIGGRVPQYFLMGTVGEAGKLEYQNAWGNNGEVPNAYLTSVASFGDLPISAMVGLYVNGVRVTLSGSGAVAQGFPVPEYSGNLWWKFFTGEQTTADAYLVAKFGADADRAWVSDMVGRGVPYLITTALWSETLWTGFPSFVGEFRGIPLYDPRLDTTAGGSGSQRWDDQSTWAFSDNNMVMIYNIERGIYYAGAHVWGGKKTAAEMPYEAWAAAMDACDEDVALDAGGSEKRFRAGRRIALNERPGDVIKELLIGCNGRIVHCADGTVYPLVGVPDEADGAFTDADVLATNALGTIPFPNLDEIINGATATYREPLQAWEDKETAPYLRSDLEAEDDGRQQIEGLDLGTTFSGTQAQRILKAVIEEGRRFRQHVVALPPEYAQFRPLQVLAWSSDRFDYSTKLFLITARTVEPFGNVILGLQEIDPADHNWTPSEDEQPLSFAPVVTNRPAPQEVSAPSVAPVPGELAFDAFWSSASVTVDVDFVRITYRLPSDDTSRVTIPVPKPDLLLGAARVPVPLLLSNTAIEVQLEYISGSGREMVASAWMPVTIAQVFLPPEMVDLANVAQSVLDQMGFSPRRLIEQFKQFGTLLEEVDRENFTKRETLFREIQVELEGLEASFTEVIEVALGPGGAIAVALESLYAAMGGNSSQVNVRWEAVAAPEGYSARYAIQAAVDDGTFRAATFFLDVPADPGQPTRIGLMAGQTVFYTAEGVPISVIDEDGFQRSANGLGYTSLLTGERYWRSE